MTSTSESAASTAAYAALGREIASRHEWLRVTIGPGERFGHDVVLTLDGSYSERETALEMAQFFGRRLDALMRQASAAYRADLAAEISPH